MSRMVRRILIVAGAALVVAALVTALTLRQIVFGGTPTIHRLAGAATSAATPCPTIGPSSQSLAFSISTQRSSAQYQAQFLVQGQAVPGTVTGVTGDVSGTFVLTPEPNPTIQSLAIVVKLTNLDSGSADRDGHVANDTLEIAKYPNATFTSSGAQVLAGNYVAGESVTFKLTGNLTLHGVTRPATFDMQGTLDGTVVTGSGASQILLPDYGMKPPQTTALVTVTVNDRITLLVHFIAERTGCAS